MSKYPNTLGRIEAVWNKLGGEAGVDRLLAGELVVCERTSEVSIPALLAALNTIDLPAVVRFVVSDHLVTENTPDGVQLYYVGDNVRANFFEKVESNVPACTLHSHRLTKSSVDKPILTELADRATTTFAYLWELLKKQPKGEKGILLTNGRSNIFYIQDVIGNSWAVRLHWRAGGGWYVRAYSVSYPDGWNADDVVFSH